MHASLLLLLAITTPPQQEPQARSLLGKPLSSPAPSQKLLQRFEEKQSAYKQNPDSAETLIWYGRFLAYKGDYREAIRLYTLGTKKFPNDARIFRHRAHRYITIRQFDEAIADMNRAVELIRGKPNEGEPDGMPNAKNIPVSTLHGNIYYHLGLTHYLKGNFPKALNAYRKCLRLKTNDDNTVSATHWVYMILRRMGRDEEAREVLNGIRRKMNIVENFSYHKACLFYKGELPATELRSKQDATDAPANDASRYALANWHLYNGETDKARAAFEAIVAGSTWQSFGHIAAEADLARMRNQQVAIETTPDLKIGPVPSGRLDVFKPSFTKYVNVFGVHIFGTRRTPDAKLRHVAAVMAEYLDNDEDGKVDNKKVVDALVSRDAYMVIAASERDMDRIDPEPFFDGSFHAGQSQWATETAPADAFDATLEEVFHLITNHGYANAYPEVFGTKPGTKLADCLDAARGGRFEDVPRRYPRDAWFSYDDDTCEYECQITEYIYWAMTSMLGAQKPRWRQREIADEWKLPTRELVKERDPAVFKLLSDPRYKFPTRLPDGRYRSEK